MITYQLPDGRLVDINAFSGEHAREAPVVMDFTLADGRIVKAVRADCSVEYGYASSETAYGRTVNYGFALKVF